MSRAGSIVGLLIVTVGVVIGALGLYGMVFPYPNQGYEVGVFLLKLGGAAALLGAVLLIATRRHA